MKTLFTISLIFLFLSPLNAQHNDLNYKTAPNHYQEIGKGQMHQENRYSDQLFNKIVVGNGIQLLLTTNTHSHWTVEAQKNLIPLVSSTIDNNTLTLSLKSGLHTKKGIKVYIPMHHIQQITVKEGAHLHIAQTPQQEQFHLYLQSGSTADCNIKTNQFIATVMGGSSLHLQGTATQQAHINIKGGSTLNGDRFSCTTGNITVLGHSACFLHIDQKLTAKVNNHSTLYYSGQPTIYSNMQENGAIQPISKKRQRQNQRQVSISKFRNALLP